MWEKVLIKNQMKKVDKNRLRRELDKNRFRREVDKSIIFRVRC